LSTDTVYVADQNSEHGGSSSNPSLRELAVAGVDMSQLANNAVSLPNAQSRSCNNDEVNSNVMDSDVIFEDAINLKFSTTGVLSLDSIQSSNPYMRVQNNGDIADRKDAIVKSSNDASPAALFPGTLSEQNQNWIGAQILALPRDVANSLNLSRPITVRFNNRSIIVPSSCVALTAEGAKVLLPPHTLSPPSRALLSEPMDFSVHLTTDASHCRQTPDELVHVEDNGKECNNTYADKSVNITIEKERDNHESDNPNASEVGQVLVKEAEKQQDYDGCVGIEVLDSNLDCMLHVLSYLGVMDLVRLSAVCERWRDISQHKSLVCITHFLSGCLLLQLYSLSDSGNKFVLPLLNRQFLIDEHCLARQCSSLLWQKCWWR